MKFFSSLTVLCLAGLTFAQEGALGTKPDVVTKTAETATSQPIVNGWEFLQMGLALAIVFALLKYGLPKIISKWGGRMKSSSNSSIKIEESASFGGGTLQVVTVRGKSVLLAVSQSGVQFLTEVGADPLEDGQPAFFELMDQSSEKEEQELLTKAVVNDLHEENKAKNKVEKAYSQSSTKTPEKDESNSSDDLKSRLERLNQLVK